MDILFPSFLYLWGVLLASAIYRALSWEFLAWTSFLWGALAWTFGGMLFIVLKIPFYASNMLFYCLILSILALTTHRLRPRQLPTKEIMRQMLLIFVLFVAVIAIISMFNFVSVSNDSIIQLLVAKGLAENQVTDAVLQQFGDWGLMLPVLHAAAFWSGSSAYITIQTAFGFTLVGTLWHVCQLGLRRISSTTTTRRWLPIAILLLLASNYFVVFQSVYVHNSIFSAAYMLPAIILLWLAHSEADENLLYPACALFLGFALTRTESVLFVGLFVFIAITYKRFSVGVWWRAMLPYVVMLLLWHLWLLVIVQPDAIILTTERVLILIAVIVATYLLPFGLLLGLNDGSLRRFQQVILWAMLLVWIALTIVAPYHMLWSTFNSVRNLILSGLNWWGVIWIAVFLSLWSLRHIRDIPYHRILTYSIIGFFLLTWLLGFPRTPYRNGWGDSSNRMFTHVLPIILFYLSLKIDKWLHALPQNEEIIP